MMETTEARVGVSVILLVGCTMLAGGERIEMGVPCHVTKDWQTDNCV